MTKYNVTAPFFFVLQDDVDLQIDAADVAYILSALESRDDVQYVKLWWGDEPAAGTALNNYYEAHPGGDAHPMFGKLTRTHTTGATVLTLRDQKALRGRGLETFRRKHEMHHGAVDRESSYHGLVDICHHHHHCLYGYGSAGA